MSLSARTRLALIAGARARLERLKLPDTALMICVAGLARMEAILARPPRVRILGEVNSGKTSVAGLLLGVGILPASVVANTRLPVLIRHAGMPSLHLVGADGSRYDLTGEELETFPDEVHLVSLEIGLPSDRLEEFEILDAPAPTELGGDDLDADIFIWCTVATRAWTESERARWSAVPHRCRRNALLVATHRDALSDPEDAAKVERRLRAVSTTMFRDVLLVAAPDVGRSRPLQLDALAEDEEARALHDRVAAWAREIRERRLRKADRIICRLARLTFHQLARTSLQAEEARILKSWESDCARLLGELDRSATGLAGVIQGLLARFAQALEWTRPGGIRRQAAWPALPAGEAPPSWPSRGPAARRFARLIAADLTALLRIELARTGLREPALYADYAMARAILLPLANLDSVFDDLGQLLASAGANAGSAEADQPRTHLRT